MRPVVLKAYQAESSAPRNTAEARHEAQLLHQLRCSDSCARLMSPCHSEGLLRVEDTDEVTDVMDSANIVEITKPAGASVAEQRPSVRIGETRDGHSALVKVPGIMRILHSFDVGGCFFSVLEFCPGEGCVDQASQMIRSPEH